MRFSDVLKEAFTITWRYRWFWIAGFLIYPQLIGGYPMDFQYQPGDEFPMQTLVMIMIVGSIGAVFILLAGSILQPAIILATSRARSGTPIKVGEALRLGYEYAARCLGLALLWFGCVMLIVLMLGVPVIIAFISAKILGVVVAVFFIPIGLILGLILVMVMNHAYRNVVLLNMGVGDSVSKAFEQLKSTKMASAGLALTAMLIPALAVSPLSFVVTMMQVAMEITSLNSMLLKSLFFIVNVILSIPIAGFFGAWACVLWTIAHQEWFGDGSSVPNAKF